MKRREFVGLLGGAVATLIRPRASSAQPVKVPRVGFLGLPSADSLPKRTDAFRTGLRELGYHEGQASSSNTAGRTAVMTGFRRCWRN
jgi:hypothetical protein